MGRELAGAFRAAQHVFDEVDSVLGQKLSRLMWDGPKEELTLTENAQPALMAVSMAVMRVLETETGLQLKACTAFVAGHSLGEYSALAAAGSLSLADTARLLKLRGRAMQAAVPAGQGAMVALLGANLDTARIIAVEASRPGEVCEVANDNDPAQIVLSGHKDAVGRVAEIGKAHGVRRTIPLPVSAPFHCMLMQPAALAMAEALASVTIHAPSVPIVANVTALPVHDPVEIRKNLVAQVTGTVRWRETMLFLAAHGVADIWELGAGKVLAGLAKRCVATLDARSLGTPSDIAAALPLLHSAAPPAEKES